MSSRNRPTEGEIYNTRGLTLQVAGPRIPGIRYDPHDLLPMTATPQKLGRYEILEEIGKGAMGVVYLARDPLIGRLVALKTFRVGFAARDEELQQFRSRFVREAQSAGILSHPHIVTIHDVVDEGPGGTCFIAMEYVKGTNLKHLLQRPDPMPLTFVVDVLAQVAEALDYAHSRGVVHRDIKPANILITPDDRVKITDFGIARIESSNLTMEGQLLGTPNYMAPEQIQGRDVDHRADIFSLGVLFYEMLTRRKPFQGENLTAVTHKIVYDPFPPPQEIVRDIPQGFTEILERCLEKDPNRRYPRAAEVARELRAVLQEQEGLEDTVATQEVDPIDEAVDALDAPAKADASDSAAADSEEDTGSTGSRSPAPDMAPTRLVERPPIPEAKQPPPSPPPPDAFAPTEMVARPTIAPPPDAFAPTEMVARPAVPSSDAFAPTELVARPTDVPKPPETSGQKAPAGLGAATVLTAVPRGASGPVPSARQAASKGDPALDADRGGRRRTILVVAVAALAAFGLAALMSVWLRGRAASDGVPSEAAPAPTREQQNRVTAAGAIQDARSQLALGHLELALQAVARAELAEPGSVEAVALREEIEARQRELEDAARDADLDRRLESARYAFAERRYSDAATGAKAILAIDPDHAEAKKIAADADRSLRRLQERQEAVEAARLAAEQRAADRAAQAEAADAQPAGPVPKEAQLHIFFASDLSEGVLTIYANDRQIIREPFKFVRRTGFFSREKVSGTIEAVRRVPAGEVMIRVYVALQGQRTQTVTLGGTADGGSQVDLRIQVDGEGEISASLR